MQISLGKILFTLIMIPLYLNAYSFTMHMDNTHPMIGEKCTLTLNFSYTNLEEYEVEEPDFENFDISLLEDKEYQDKNGTWQAQQRYQLIPYKAGAFRLPSLKTHIEMIEEKYQERYNKNKYLKKFDIFTKTIMINVQPLPQGITITGDYQLYAHIDANTTTLGKPIRFTVSIKGEGNIPSLDFLTLNIPHTTIYEKPITESEKSFDILANANFTIPPILLKYYNQKTKQITLLNTPPFDIEVTGGKPEKQPFQIFWWIIFPLFLLLWGFPKFFAYDEKKALKKQLQHCKDKETLLKKLMPYLDKNRQLTRLIYELEVVEIKEFKKLKKKILKYF